MFSLKINKRGDPNKVRGGRKKIGKLISGRGGGTPESNSMGELLFSHIRVTKVKLIYEKNA